MPDAPLGHITVCLQTCPQHNAEKTIYRPRTRTKVFVTSKDWPGRKLHNDFENAPLNGEKKDGSRGAEDENQTARYFVMVEKSTELRLWRCEVCTALYAWRLKDA